MINNYEKIIDDQGKKNHEYNNQLLILMGYIDNKKKLKEYLNTIIDDHKTGQHYQIKQLSHLPKGGIKNLLYYKIKKMKDNNIKYYLYVTDEVKDKIEKFSLKDYKCLTKILGVLIDNAIDASLLSESKEVITDFKINDNYLLITISNSFSSDTEVKMIGKRKYSTKGFGHGYGLLIVNEIIKTNNRFELVSDVNDNLFSQTVLIDLK